MRDPMALFGRYARQMLVEGWTLRTQQALGWWAIVPRDDGSVLGREISHALARYLVGAGIGRIAPPGPAPTDGHASDAGRALRQFDDALVVLQSGAQATPPVVHAFASCQPYGASVELIATEGVVAESPDAESQAGDAKEPNAHATAWLAGRGSPARVMTLRCDLGGPGRPEDAVAIACAAADLVLRDLAGVAALPALATLHLDGGSAGGQTDAIALALRPAQPAGPSPARVSEAATERLDPMMNPATQATVWAVCEAAYPHEACGLVLQRADGTVAVEACANEQDRYHALDPVTWPRTARTAFRLDERAILRALDRGDRLLGIFHSHCDAGAYLSVEDRQVAAPDGVPAWPGVAWLVASVIDGRPAGWGFYRFDPGRGEFSGAYGTMVTCLM